MGSPVAGQLRLLLVGLMLVAGCVKRSAGPVQTQASKTALQYSGSIVGVLVAPLLRTAASDESSDDAGTSDAGTSDAGTRGERWELSAPIIPKVLKLYPYQGAALPTTLADEQSLANGAALNFDALRTECVRHYPGIKVWVAGTPELTRDELERNYDLVAQCAYDRYTAKPYWIPQLVDDVDLCASQLGTDWHLVSEIDLASLDEAAYRLFARTLADVGGTASGGGSISYFSLAVYLRANDATLKLGNLNPGVANRVTDLPVSGDALRTHLERSPIGSVVLRCIRHSTI